MILLNTPLSHIIAWSAVLLVGVLLIQLNLWGKKKDK